MADRAAAGTSKGRIDRDAALRATAAIYLATGMCFGAGVVRDCAACTLPDTGRAFFEVMYVASLASTWGINAIQLGTSPPTRRFAFDVAMLTAIIVVIASAAVSSYSVAGLLAALTTSAMWLAGAVASRAQLARGFPFSARIREAVASLLIAAMVVAGVNDLASLCCGVVISTIWMLAVSWSTRTSYFSRMQDSHEFYSSFRSIVASNAAVAIMTLWAIRVNRLDMPIFGVSAQWAARLSSYLFQAIAVGWMVLATKPDLAPEWASRHGRKVCISLFAAAIACAAWSIEASCIVMPVFLGVGQYTLIASRARSRADESHD